MVNFQLVKRMNFGDIKIVDGRVFINPASSTVWLTQHQIANLFECFVGKVNANIRAILKSGILDESKVCRTYRYQNGNSTELYNLEMITALAFRIRSHNSDLFRQWLMKKAARQTGNKEFPIFITWTDTAFLN